MIWHYVIAISQIIEKKTTTTTNTVFDSILIAAIWSGCQEIRLFKMLTLFRTDIYSLIMPTPESVLSSISHNAPSPTSMDTIDYNTHMTTMPICTHDHCHITVMQIQVAHTWTPPGHLHTHIIIFTWTFTS